MSEKVTEMKLWLLRPATEERGSLWHPWYCKAFGFVVQAMSEAEARRMAAAQCGHEGAEAWESPELSTCAELRVDSGEARIVMCDYAGE